MPEFMHIVKIVGLLLGVVVVNAAYAQEFPNKPLRVVVPYAPGGPIDAVVRIVTKSVSATIGQPVIVDNRPGGNTFIGMGACAKAAPDGYTVCATNSDALSLNPFAFKKIPYDPQKDLVGVTRIVTPTVGIVTSAKTPFNDFKGMVAYAAANPGKLNFGSFGAGSIADLYSQWLRKEKKVEMEQVPYRGSAPIIQAMLNDEVQVTWAALATTLPYIKEGKLKIVAILGENRTPELPDVPTFAELGADNGLKSYFGLYAPAKTPSQALERLNRAFRDALRDPEVMKILAGLNMQPGGNSVEDINRSMKAEYETARSRQGRRP